MKKRSPPHILADEHFKENGNPPSADYRALDGVLKPLLKEPCDAAKKDNHFRKSRISFHSG
jgi:hypothetical protein